MTITRNIIPVLLFFSLLFTAPLVSAQSDAGEPEETNNETTITANGTTPETVTTEMTSAAEELSLITANAEEGFQLAVTLSRKGVTTTQPNRDVLFMLRDVYANDPDALIASSQVIAIHFQTIAAANNYWR